MNENPATSLRGRALRATLIPWHLAIWQHDHIIPELGVIYTIVELVSFPYEEEGIEKIKVRTAIGDPTSMITIECPFDVLRSTGFIA